MPISNRRHCWGCGGADGADRQLAMQPPDKRRSIPLAALANATLGAQLASLETEHLLNSSSRILCSYAIQQRCGKGLAPFERFRIGQAALFTRVGVTEPVEALERQSHHA